MSPEFSDLPSDKTNKIDKTEKFDKFLVTISAGGIAYSSGWIVTKCFRKKYKLENDGGRHLLPFFAHTHTWLMIRL